MRFIDFLNEKEIKWAINSNLQHAIKNYSHRDDFMIVWLDPSEVISNVDPDMRVDPNDPTNHIGNRMDRAISHFNSDKYMDPPVIAYDRYTNDKYKIIVDDGRHRIAALKKMGIKEFPAYIMKSDLSLIKTILTVKSK